LPQTATQAGVTLGQKNWESPRGRTEETGKKKRKKKARKERKQKKGVTEKIAFLDLPLPRLSYG